MLSICDFLTIYDVKRDKAQIRITYFHFEDVKSYTTLHWPKYNYMRVQIIIIRRVALARNNLSGEHLIIAVIPLPTDSLWVRAEIADRQCLGSATSGFASAQWCWNHLKSAHPMITPTRLQTSSFGWDVFNRMRLIRRGYLYPSGALK